MKFKNKIKILVQPTYLEDHSDPSENSYLWAYTVKIKNNGEDTIKLISRHWKIFDSNGMVPRILTNNEYLLVPKNYNVKKILN